MCEVWQLRLLLIADKLAARNSSRDLIAVEAEPPQRPASDNLFRKSAVKGVNVKGDILEVFEPVLSFGVEACYDLYLT